MQRYVARYDVKEGAPGDGQFTALRCNSYERFFDADNVKLAWEKARELKSGLVDCFTNSISIRSVELA